MSGALALLGGIAWLFLPRGPEEFPLADLVPEDAVLYVAFRDVAELDRLPAAWIEPFRGRLDEARPHLAGGLALYLDRQFEWVFLARLRRGVALLAGGDAFATAESPGALERHRARKGSILENPDFRALGARIFVDLQALNLPFRLGDFSALGLDVESRSPLVLRGRAKYKPALYPAYLEHYVQAPRVNGIGVDPMTVRFTERPARLWQEVLERLSEEDREFVLREKRALEKDFLGGGSFETFLGRLGPSCGIRVEAARNDLPEVTAWMDLPDPATHAPLGEILPRAGFDWLWHLGQRREAAPYGLWREGDLWRIKIHRPWAERLSPAGAVRNGRLILSTRADGLDVSKGPPGEAHVTAAIQTASLFEALRAAAPILAAISGSDEKALRGRVERWAVRLKGLDSISLTGRHTGGGLEVKILLATGSGAR